MSSVTGFSSVQQWLRPKRKERVEMRSWRLPSKMQNARMLQLRTDKTPSLSLADWLGGMPGDGTACRP